MSLQIDSTILFATRAARMFAYGGLAVVLVLYLSSVGFSGLAIGALLAATLGGDALVSLWLTSHADRFGRRRTLIVGASLMALGGVLFSATSWLPLLLAAATVAVISPNGNEVGPFLAIEQAGLAQLVGDRGRTRVFAWYNLTGSLATAAGALVAGGVAQALLSAGSAQPEAYRAVLVGYALIGGLLGVAFWRLSPRIEVADGRSSAWRSFGLHRSQRLVMGLAALFAVDAFAGGLVAQSLIAYWFHTRFGADSAVLGGILFGANLLAGVSALAAARLASRFGLLNTMVFTHLPSNVLLVIMPFMPTLGLAVAVLLLRFAFSQMDVPTRQSYTMAVVDPDERSAAAGITNVARTAGAAVSPLIAAPLIVAGPLAPLAFVSAGALKIAYDIGLYLRFRATRPVEESGR